MVSGLKKHQYPWTAGPLDHNASEHQACRHPWLQDPSTPQTREPCRPEPQPTRNPAQQNPKPKISRNPGPLEPNCHRASGSQDTARSQGHKDPWTLGLDDSRTQDPWTQRPKDPNSQGPREQRPQNLQDHRTPDHKTKGQQQPNLRCQDFRAPGS